MEKTEIPTFKTWPGSCPKATVASLATSWVTAVGKLRSLTYLGSELAKFAVCSIKGEITRATAPLMTPKTKI
ncbi:hypothetical protein A2630_00895 [Candidatus Woesebacteria bacterium RIFCSPHIGHO2_01_FULL_44_10]|uniref:Uncharacterized protein n=1 Tax=Candidatus Woesebacteria bacterium RIFCSPLOWO2_01_FULL_44_14 TaxID=1802525 RepID=A0A1F8C1M1_9BACT|nr:MAG: hypothetical protein A2630_00895 [Candidatus Woesebacteria bacterium RIFCSPHIGHO2_01_FULL_44_10]OGM54322.1 MAG: hypothetical protein A3F62_01030 [Candidatus Woesebacteria bacterium RIFCSPHIGHO2_12_FULL_44_11]OGM70223.1 MAG: hypothetical protein A2975_04080 [Candidatus Woesebacteria bacterium RIFCSPLOWO2_01_FULL_44_14]